jgi:hypothetical protein
MDEKNPCGWSGTIHDFLHLSKPHWLIAMQEHHQRCMNCPGGFSLIKNDEVIRIKKAYPGYMHTGR